MGSYGLAKFSEPDNIQGVACVPKTSNAQTPQLVPLNNTDIVTDFDFLFTFKGTSNAYTGTGNLSPYFPYNFVNQLKLPYQSNAVSAANQDAHKLWLMDVLRRNNRRYGASGLLSDQKALLSTGYTPQTLLGSSGSYAIAPSTAETYQFRIKVPVAMYFDRFYDSDASGKLGAIDDVYVSPLFMSSIGRSITPVIQLNPVWGTRYDQSPLVQTGSLTTAATWTDNGSNLSIQRNGFREPDGAVALPPAFNWAYNIDYNEIAFAGTAKASFTLPLQGQLLSVTCVMFDPSLNSNAGGVIPVANINTAVLQYGAGIAKYNDVPITLQTRMLENYGVLPTDGVFTWDMYSETRSNVDAINTYTTSAVKFNLDLGSNTPGAGAYVGVLSEWLTVVG